MCDLVQLFVCYLWIYFICHPCPLLNALCQLRCCPSFPFVRTYLCDQAFSIYIISFFEPKTTKSLLYIFIFETEGKSSGCNCVSGCVCVFVNIIFCRRFRLFVRSFCSDVDFIYFIFFVFFFQRCLKFIWFLFSVVQIFYCSIPRKKIEVVVITVAIPFAYAFFYICGGRKDKWGRKKRVYTVQYPHKYAYTQKS